MVIKKVFMTAALAGALVLGGFTIVHAEGNDSNSTVVPKHQGAFHHHQDRVSLEKFAKKLGIDPTGMTKKELKQAIKAKCKEKLVAKAKSLGIDPTGKSMYELKQAVHEKMLNDPAHLKKMAKRLGISTEGKTNAQLKAAVQQKLKAKHHERLVKWAKKLGISTEGKTDKELHDAIHKKMQERQD